MSSTQRQSDPKILHFGQKVVDERPFFTNDRAFEKQKKQLLIVESQPIILDMNQLITTERSATDLDCKSVEEMTSEEYKRYINQKRNPSLGKKISNLFDGASSFIFRNAENSQRSAVASSMLEQAAQLTINDLGCSSISEAFQKYTKSKKDKDLLFKCIDINIDGLIAESLDIKHLKHYGFTFHEVNKKFNIRWQDICQKLNLTAADLTREDSWFDVKTLADCVNCQKGNLIHDIGFNIDDIRRLQCADAEISQFNINFDLLCKEIGFTKKDFRDFPWYPDTMVELLGLDAKHLSKAVLDLKREDFAFLILNRKHWNFDFFKSTLKMEDKLISFLFTYALQCRDSGKITKINNDIAADNLNSFLTSNLNLKPEKKVITLGQLYGAQENKEDRVSFENQHKQHQYHQQQQQQQHLRQQHLQQQHQRQQQEDYFFGQSDLQQREKAYLERKKLEKTKTNSNGFEGKKFRDNNDELLQQSKSLLSTQTDFSEEGGDENQKTSVKLHENTVVEFISSIDEYYGEQCAVKKEKIVIL